MMPVIRCPKCGDSYDVPADVAVTLPRAIARCRCGEWLSGSRAALLARQIDPGDLQEIDMREYRIIDPEESLTRRVTEETSDSESRPRSIRVVARGADESVNTVFTVHEHPMWIGRKGCHLELDDAELSIRHCAVIQRGGRIFLRDEDSHTGTFLDGEPVEPEAEIGEGVHVLRAGTALVCIEPVNEPGIPVEPITLEPENVLDASPLLVKKLLEKAAARSGVARKAYLICLEGPLAGQEFEIPEDGLVVGREGTVKVADDYLSRRHFEVVRDEPSGIRVRDLGSRNGTFLNTLPAKNAKVHPGDEIRAGINRFRIEER